MPFNTFSPNALSYHRHSQADLPELDGNELPPRYELAGGESPAPHASPRQGHLEVAATGRGRSVSASRQSDATNRTAASFRSLCKLANAVIRDPKFEFENKAHLENLIYEHYQTYPLSPAEAAEIRSRQTPEQYRVIFDFMAGLAHKTPGVTIHMSAPGEAELGKTPFQAVWDAMCSGSEEERRRLYSTDFVIKPRTGPNEAGAGRPEARWVELSITVRGKHACALAEVLVNLVSRAESRRGPGMVRQALLVAASRQDTSSITGVVHFSEAGAEHALAEEANVHAMLMGETGATLSDLYVSCPPGWETAHPDRGIGCFERSSAGFHGLDTGRLISRILADAISESCRFNLDVPEEARVANAISFHLGTNGYTNARLPVLHAHMLPHRRTHSASAIFKVQTAPAVTRALQEPGFRELFEMTQRIAKDPACNSSEPKSITKTVYQYYTNFPYSPAEAHEIRTRQVPAQLVEKIYAFNDLATRYVNTVDIYMQGIGEGGRLRPGEALEKLAGKLGYEKARDKVCNANLIIARAGTPAPMDQKALRSVLSVSVKEPHALRLAEVLTEVVATQVIANTRIDGFAYIEFSKIVSLGSRAETAAIHFVEPDFLQIAELAEKIDKELTARIPWQGPEEPPVGELYGRFPPSTLAVRRGMIYWEIPPNMAREAVPSKVHAMSKAIVDNKRDGKDTATALHTRLGEKGHLPEIPPFALLANEGGSLARARDCIRKLRSRTPEDMEGLQPAHPGIRVTPAELSAD